MSFWRIKMHRFSANELYTILSILLICALGISLWEVGRRLLIEYMIHFYGDAGIYFATGRGITNGLVPYDDLLEIKPPGIFLVTAASYIFSGDESLAVFLRFFTIVGIPVLLVCFALYETRKLPRVQQLLLCTLSCLFGVQLMLYIIEKAGGFQTEAFGAFFGTLYVLAASTSNQFSVKRIIVLGALLLFTIGLKEPFLLSLAGAALFLTGANLRAFAHIFLLPLLLAAIAGGLIMIIAGWWDPYFSTYLPLIFQDRVNGDIPLLQRGFLSFFPLGDLIRTQSKIPWAGAAIIALVCLSPLLLVQRSIAFIARKKGMLIIPIAVALIGLYLTTLSTGVGNFLLQHYLFAIPAYVSLYMIFLKYILSANVDTRSRHIVLLIIVSLLFLTVMQHPNADYDTKRLEYTAAAEDFAISKSNAAQIDEMLDTCGFDRYMQILFSQISGFTRHSPLDLAWTQHRAFAKKPHAGLRQRFFERLAQAPVAVIWEGAPLWDDEELRAYLRLHFTEQAPTCAQSLPKLPYLQILYRISQ